ncbi:MAG: hypothetical protein HQL56_07965 [Magnetococcales bacterium]|nr:hypothetical protein [Magnetococcales bacterium]
MSASREFQTLLLPDKTPLTAQADQAYLRTRDQVIRQLTHYTLIESYHQFRKENLPYPFVPPANLRPGAVATTREYKLQNNALVILINSVMSARLRKHFRCRESNRVNKKNIAAVAPDIPALERYHTDGRDPLHARFGDLMRMLLPLDYALFIQKEGTEENPELEFSLTHFHVRIERLTDNALKSLGMHLNYFGRSLYEHGDEFVETFERKFFEYFNFYHNAAGRRSAAALAAQLLSRERIESTIFVASQQDRRLSLLSNNGKEFDTDIEQYLLVRLDADEVQALEQWSKSRPFDFRHHFLIDGGNAEEAVAVLRVRYAHTPAAMPAPSGIRKLQPNLRERWVKIIQEALIPIDGDCCKAILYPVAYRRAGTDEAASEKG